MHEEKISGKKPVEKMRLERPEKTHARELRQETRKAQAKILNPGRGRRRTSMLPKESGLQVSQRTLKSEEMRKNPLPCHQDRSTKGGIGGTGERNEDQQKGIPSKWNHRKKLVQGRRRLGIGKDSERNSQRKNPPIKLPQGGKKKKKKIEPP